MVPALGGGGLAPHSGAALSVSEALLGGAPIGEGGGGASSGADAAQPASAAAASAGGSTPPRCAGLDTTQVGEALDVVRESSGVASLSAQAQAEDAAEHARPHGDQPAGEGVAELADIA